MQSASASRPSQQNDEHLSPVAAKMFLAALPERIQWALLAYAGETQYPLEIVLEMACASRYPQAIMLNVKNQIELR